MNKHPLIMVGALVALAAFCAWGDWIYEGQWGTKGSGEGQFYGPCDVDAPYDGHVYVTDSANYRVQYFTPSRTYVWGTRGSGNGEFLGTRGITVSDDDIVYVVDGLNHRVQYFTRTG